MGNEGFQQVTLVGFDCWAWGFGVWGGSLHLAMVQLQLEKVK